MLGLIGLLINGIAYTVGWMSEEQREQRSRQSSKEKGLDWYYDKNNRQRWTSTGRKRTPQEILKEYEDNSRRHEIESKRAIENMLLDSYKKDYDLYAKKEKITFEEYVACHLDPSFLKYDKIRKMVESVPEERIREIKERDYLYYM